MRLVSSRAASLIKNIKCNDRACVAGVRRDRLAVDIGSGETLTLQRTGVSGRFTNGENELEISWQLGTSRFYKNCFGGGIVNE